MPDHRIERARERYGLTLTLGDITALERQVCQRTCIRRDDDKGEMHILFHGKTPLLAVVQCFAAGIRIATFLPMDHIIAGSSRARGRANTGKALKVRGKRRLHILEQRMARREG